MFDKEIIKRKRYLPHWTSKYAVYFITFSLIKGEFSDQEKDIVFNHIVDRNNNFYRLHSLIVMSDHVHLILNCIDGYSLSRVMKGIKGVTSNLVNKSRETRGSIWLDESFDRIIRDEKEYDEKMVYMYNNAVKKGLVEYHEDYKWWFYNNDLD